MNKDSYIMKARETIRSMFGRYNQIEMEPFNHELVNTALLMEIRDLLREKHTNNSFMCNHVWKFTADGNTTVCVIDGCGARIRK